MSTRTTSLKSTTVREPELERQSRRLAWPAGRFGLIFAALFIPGVILFVLGSSWVSAIGIALIGLSAPVFLVFAGLSLSALVAHWTARHRPVA